MLGNSSNDRSSDKKPMHWFGVYVRGIAMGSADVIPGVSGGTIAFIAGIYERLIQAIAAVTKSAWPAFRKEGVRGAWNAIDGWFLAALFAGIATSLLTFAKLITWLLQAYPQLLWSFFFGLVLASSFLIWKLVKQWNWKVAVTFIIATLLTWWITSATPATTPDGLWFVFVSGFIAISAMILPGISGSFMLVLLGQYSRMLEAIDTMNIPVVLVFLVGCAIGIATASRVIGWLFHRYHDVAVTAIVGIMLGSLNKIWPWKETLMYRTAHDGSLEPLIQHNIAPWHYEAAAAMPPYTGWAIVLMIVGIVLIVGIERYRASKEKKQAPTA